jgi:hypothetical protein
MWGNLVNLWRSFMQIGRVGFDFLVILCESSYHLRIFSNMPHSQLFSPSYVYVACILVILFGVVGCANDPATSKTGLPAVAVATPSIAAPISICYQPVCCNDSAALRFEPHRLNCQSIAEKTQNKINASLTSLMAAIQAALSTKLTQKDASNEVLCYALNDAAHRASGAGDYDSKSSSQDVDKKSLQLFTDSYLACQTRFGASSDAAAQSLYGIANHHLANGRIAEAKPMMQQVLVSSIASGNKVLQSFTTDALGRIADVEGDFVTGKNLLNQAIQLKKTVFGERSAEMAVSYTNLGASYIESKDGVTGREWYRRSISIYSELFGDADDRTLNVFAALVTSHLFDGELKKAESMYAALAPKFTQTYGATDERTVTLINDWGVAFARQNRYQEAFLKFDLALKIRRKSMPNSLNHGHSALNTAKMQNMMSGCNDKKTLALRIESSEIALALLKANQISRLQYEENNKFSDEIAAFHEECSDSSKK